MRPAIIPPRAKYQPQEPETVTNDTASKDPQIMKARIFVGCLNTEICRREDLIELFSMYGPLTGLTHFHKQGYAFVQFDREGDALDAVANLNEYYFQGFNLDVKIATPRDNFITAAPKDGPGAKLPKSRGRRGGRKERERRERLSKMYGAGGENGNAEDEYNDYDAVGPRQDEQSGNADTNSAATSQSGGDLVPPPPVRQQPQPSVPAAPKEERKPEGAKDGVQLNENEIPDVFVCGGCHLITANAQFFVEHRLIPCDRKPIVKGEDEPETLKCYTCKYPCKNSWELVTHMGKAHNLTLYNESTPNTDEYPNE